MEYQWECKNCGKRFNPLSEDGSFNFNCPRCGSELTVPIRDIQTETNSTGIEE